MPSDQDRHAGASPAVPTDSFDIADALLELSIGQPLPAAQPAAPSVEQPQTPTTVVQDQEPTSVSNQSPQNGHFVVEQPHNESNTVKEVSVQATPKQSSLVLLQDACNLHKFSRNIRVKDLETIVERPERTRAAILGILNAKTELDMSASPSFDIVHTTRDGNLGDEAVEAVHGHVFPQDLLRMARNVEEKLSRGELEISADLPYGDLYLGPQSLAALNGCIGAVYDGIDALYAPREVAAQGPSNTLMHHYGAVHVCIRPPGHHAAEASPCGFCWINNVHIGIAYARKKYNVDRAVIFDFDLHHGDGSQSIAWTLNEANPNSVAYYSLHDIYSYPCESGNIDKIREASVSISAHGHNIHNEILQPYRDMADFENLYTTRYSRVFDAAEKYLAEGQARGQRSLVCISAGYDASEYESTSMQRHAVSVPTAFYERFTADAVRLAKRFCQGKVFSVMEGGYGDRAITSAATAHMLGLVSDPATATSKGQTYGIERLKSIEKHFPGKQKSNRKSVKVETTLEPWLDYMTTLHDQHLPSAQVPNGSLKQTEEHLALLELQRMTLRERKPRATPVATPRAARATPRATPAANKDKFLIKFKIPSAINGVNSEPPKTPISNVDHAAPSVTPDSTIVDSPTPVLPAREPAEQQRDIYDFPP